MSRRPGPDRAAQNQQTIKTLLKLEANKVCADCKRNKHPRWASWNLGIFICIRCSGIHRGMGTHISRVKSVDLDAWTDEQLQSVLKWGNARANKYWEAKLASGHIPSEAKIENFIRTKYESKRWVMDGPMPDPSTLDTDGDDDVPLNIVKEKANLERSASQRASSTTSQPTSQQGIDLFGSQSAPTQRPNTTTPSITQPPPLPKGNAPSRSAKPGESLLGLDFFGNTQTTGPGRPSSAASSITSSAPSRPDLKQSILSLYASAPKPQQTPQPQSPPSSSLGTMQPPPQQAPKSSFGDLNDAFSGLNFNAAPSGTQSQAQPSSKSPPFSNLGNFASQKSKPVTPQITSPPLSIGGGFFDPPSSKADRAGSSFSVKQPSTSTGSFSSSSAFGDLKPVTSPANGRSGMDDLFDFAAPSTQPPPPKPANAPSHDMNSVFNLSNPAQTAQGNSPITTSSNGFNTKSNPSNSFANFDAWGSNDVWANPEPSMIQPTSSRPDVVLPMGTETGWGGSTMTTSNTMSMGTNSGLKEPATVGGDEDFGGWSSAPPATTSAPPSNTSKPAGSFPADDLFSNVWE